MPPRVIPRSYALDGDVGQQRASKSRLEPGKENEMDGEKATRFQLRKRVELAVKAAHRDALLAEVDAARDYLKRVEAHQAQVDAGCVKGYGWETPEIHANRRRGAGLYLRVAVEELKRAGFGFRCYEEMAEYDELMAEFSEE